MPMITTAETALPSRRRGESNGSTYWVTTFLGANRHTMPAGASEPAEDEIYPMAFLVEQDPHKVVQPHWHQADQFQVVVDGQARMGTHDVSGVAVHYSGRYSAYGPIAATEQGVHYFTLRNGWDPGAKYMPGARAELRARRVAPHRESVADPTPLGSASQGVLPLEADGLGAWRYRLAPGESLTGPDPAGGRGQNWLVLAGTAETGGAALGVFTNLFVFPDEPALNLCAGPAGVEVLCMQYPRR